MDEDDTLRQSDAWDNSGIPHRVSPYELLLRQSRKMGKAASRSYDVTKTFLRQDVTTLYPPIIRKQTREEKAERAGKKLNRIVAQSREILATAQTVILPNNLFPDTVTVDRTKITITRKTFFWSSTVISIRVEDILNVATSVGPLFGSVTISSRVMNSTDHYEINFFWRRDAIYLKHVIQGYMLVVHNNIDTSSLSKEELIKKLIELGHDPNA